MTKAIRGGGLDWRHTGDTKDLARPQRPRHRALLLAPRQPRQHGARPTPRRTATSASASCRPRCHHDNSTPAAVLLLRDRRPPAHHHRHTRALKPIDHPTPPSPSTTRTNSSPTSPARACPTSAGVSASRPASASTITTPPSRCFPTATSSPPTTTRRTTKTTPTRPSWSCAAAPAPKTGTCPNRSPSSPTPASAAPVIWNDPKSHPGKVWMFFWLPAPHRRAALRLHHLERQRRHLVAAHFPVFPAAHRPLRLAAHQLHRPRQGRHHLHPHRLHRPRLPTATAPSPPSGPPRRRQTWYDTGGRTAGRHTTIVFAHNGDLLGFGGKNSQHRRPHAARHLARRRQNLGQIQTPLRPPRQRRASQRHSSRLRPPLLRRRLQIQRTRNTSTKTAPTSRSPTTTARPGPSSTCLRTSSPSATPPPRKAPTASFTSPPPRTPSTTRSNSTKPGSSTRPQAT